MTRIGILGCGGMGRTHSRHLARLPGVSLAFFDVRHDAARALAEEHQGEAAGSFEDLLGGVDALVVCLPTDLHAVHGLAALGAKKPVLMEKPLARTLDEGRALLDAAAKADTWLMPGQVVRFFADFERGHDMVLKGAVGRPAAARTHRGGGMPGGTDGWFRNPERSGGVLLDLAVHDFDWLRWTFGEVETVYARALTGQREDGDYAVATLKFESGVVAHVEATWMDPAGFRTAFEVCGSEGMIEYDSRLAASVRVATSAGIRNQGPLAPEDDPYFRQASAFVAAVRGDSEPPVTAMDGFMALSIALTALESAQTGQALRPPTP